MDPKPRPNIDFTGSGAVVNPMSISPNPTGVSLKAMSVELPSMGIKEDPSTKDKDPTIGYMTPRWMMVRGGRWLSSIANSLGSTSQVA